MFGAIRSAGRGVQWLLWFPFAAVSHPIIFFGVIGYCWFYEPHATVITFFALLFLCGLSFAIAQRLRPSPRLPKAILPKREKPLKPGRAKSLTTSKQSPSVTSTIRRLPRQLKAILSTPADMPPEAVLHEQRVASAPSRSMPNLQMQGAEA